ncbi:MAG: hypothetical protein K2F64_06830, partial [Muribaculaceae bacterium]|nr:hypothetical protein [Muribaculaceae bacterium]
MDSTWNFTPANTDSCRTSSRCGTAALDLDRLHDSIVFDNKSITFPHLRENLSKREAYYPEFRKITVESMEEIMPYLEKVTDRTTDFSYGGILM